MAGRARHLPRHLHHRLTLAISHQPSWFTTDELLSGLGPTVQRFRRREVVTFLMQMVRIGLLQADGTRPRRFRRAGDLDWLNRARDLLAEEAASIGLLS